MPLMVRLVLAAGFMVVGAVNTTGHEMELLPLMLEINGVALRCCR